MALFFLPFFFFSFLKIHLNLRIWRILKEIWWCSNLKRWVSNKIWPIEKTLLNTNKLFGIKLTFYSLFISALILSGQSLYVRFQSVELFKTLFFFNGLHELWGAETIFPKRERGLEAWKVDEQICNSSAGNYRLGKRTLCYQIWLNSGLQCGYIIAMYNLRLLGQIKNIISLNK